MVTANALQASGESTAVPIEISAGLVTRFLEQEQEVFLLRGQVRIRQGERIWTGPQAVVWKYPHPHRSGGRVVVFLDHTPESTPTLREPGHRETRPHFLVELETEAQITLTGETPQSVPSAREDPLYKRGLERRQQFDRSIQQVQHLTPGQNQGGPALPPLSAPHASAMSLYRRRVTIGPQFLGDRIQAKADFIQDAIQPEYVITVTGGVNIVVDNVPLTLGGQTFLTRLDLSADRAVVWTDANRMGELSGFEIDEQTPFEVYLEGNIVVRQGSNTIKSARAFYDISRRRGLLIDTEIRTQIPEFDGAVRLRASEVRQFSELNFHARNAYFTTSEFGVPKYRIEASDVFLEQVPSLFPNSVDPETGLPDDGTLWITSHNNRLFIENVPVFNAPYLTGPAEEIHIPVNKVNMGYSGMFGVEVQTSWDTEKLFGWQLQEGVDLDLELDLFTARGPGVGLRTDYDTIAPLFGVPLRHEGFGHLYYLYDRGNDNLGLDRRNLVPESEHRGRILWRNRTELSPFNTLFAEVGHIFSNDRNFLEQYYENEWDFDKDLENKLRLEHQFDNVSASLMGALRSNRFENQTDWLPRADLTILGQPVLNTPINWSMHSYAGYGSQKQARGPADPLADAFVPLDYFADAEGLVAMSRHELSIPFHAGPLNVVPYVLGEVAHWQEDLTGQELTRWYGSAGVRASIQFSKYMPHVRSSILGLNGLAHKMSYEVDYYIADSSEDLARVPQFNSFDENAQERFRSRFQLLEFGGILPAEFDPRFYALRSGVGRSVTAPAHELVGDQHAVRLSMSHRLQTKVGPPHMLRTVDWMEFDAGITLFPNADRDNFGEDFGLLTGRYAWHVGPRTSLLASGAFDFFDLGQQVWNVGVLSQRSERGSIYIGYRNLEAGPIESQLITTSVSYVMTPNLYVATFGASFDIAEGVDRGQSLTITRISENFLLHFGFGYDRSRDNIGVALSLEPKFGNYGRGSMQLNSLLGIHQ